MDAAEQLDNRHKPRTLETATHVRLLRDEAELEWKVIANRLGVAPSTAIYLYGCRDTTDEPPCGVRRAIIATLGLAGPRVGELCALNNQDISLSPKPDFTSATQRPTQASGQSTSTPDFSTN
jgi:hypothetical protein